MSKAPETEEEKWQEEPYDPLLPTAEDQRRVVEKDINSVAAGTSDGDINSVAVNTGDQNMKIETVSAKEENNDMELEQKQISIAESWMLRSLSLGFHKHADRHLLWLIFT